MFNSKHRHILLSALLLVIPTMVSSAAAQELHVFERMWPTLQQPWYFFLPTDIAAGQDGSVYLADTYNHRIQKLTADGFFVKSWGRRGSNSGEFEYPHSVALDSAHQVYVADNYNHRIQKFDPSGGFIAQWGSQGDSPGEFLNPKSVAIDALDLVYVADTGNHRIQKFNAAGQFIAQWGNQGSGDGQFDEPSGIAVDHAGHVFVADSQNHRVQRFTADGEYLDQMGGFGDTDGLFNTPIGLVVDRSGNLYVVDSQNHRVQKFDSEGTFVSSWGQNGNAEGEFAGPRGIAIDSRGQVLVADHGNDRIQGFTAGGRYLTAWGAAGTRPGMFDWPLGVAVDADGRVYIADTRNHRLQVFAAQGGLLFQFGNQGSGEGQFDQPVAVVVDSQGRLYVSEAGNHRIQKFSGTGQFITQWGHYGGGSGEFNGPMGLAAGPEGSIYVVDCGNHRVQKFTAGGQFLLTWGSFGANEGQFHFPLGVEVSGQGHVLVADQINDRIQIFNTDGQFIDAWGAEGTGGGQFNSPSDVAVDSDGNVLVADRLNHRIQTFTPSGEFIAQWGDAGTLPGQMNWVDALAAGADEKIYVTDSKNHRIQVFKKVSASSNSKAIVVAGGGPFAGNHLWNATQLSANFAYRTLTHQGYTKESIHYLTSNTDLDLDGNGEADDVDGDATNSNLEQAITTWAANAGDLVVFLVDHGGNALFRMSGVETLSATDLDAWLDALQAVMPGRVIVVYDACESGSFVSALMPPAEKERVVIASTSPGESAYFIGQGSISFSNYFWSHVFSGLDIQAAFSLAATALEHTTPFQHPLLDANGNGVPNEPEDGSLAGNTTMGSGTPLALDAPVIGSVSGPQTISDTSSAELFASGVVDNDGIARVWAVVRPPDFIPGSPDSPVYELPAVDLPPSDTVADRYEATYDGFNNPGTYQMAIYARDRTGHTSIPMITSVSVENPLRNRAVIVAGGSPDHDLWPAIEKNVALAYEALSFQGYDDDDIHFLSPVTFTAGVDGLATIGNLSYAIQTWAADCTRNLVVYLVGPADEGGFQINASETLASSDMDTWLDALQGAVDVRATVVYDACRSGGFMRSLIPATGIQRILIASAQADQPAGFLSSGAISFSRFFWQNILNGATVWEAFLQAKRAIAFSFVNQTPLLDDTGNGIGNEKADGSLAQYHRIGLGIMLAGDAPLVGSIVPPQTVSQGLPATIWVENVTTTGTIQRVWAVVTPPDHESGDAGNPITDLPELNLSPVDNHRYEGIYSGFSSYGTYQVAVYAMDSGGNVSLPATTIVCHGVCTDDYETDDTCDRSQVIVINHETPQTHNFHDAGDLDWVRFYAFNQEVYTIALSNPGSNCDAVIEIYDRDGTTRLIRTDDTGKGGVEARAWTCLQDGVYFVRVSSFDAGDFGENTTYDLQVTQEVGPLAGWIKGWVVDDATGEPVSGVWITTSGNGSAISLPSGAYLMLHPPGTMTLAAEALGYHPMQYPGIAVPEAGIITQNISLTSAMVDSDGDTIPDSVDNCPGIINPDQLNLDGDQAGNACDGCPSDPSKTDPGTCGCGTGDKDTDEDGEMDCQDADDDNDGMPDDWEEAYSLDPLKDDAADDTDNDGLSNVEEYQLGSDPLDPNDPRPRSLPWIPVLLD